MDRSLIQIAQDANALEEILFSTDGEMNEALETWLDEVKNNITAKADNYHFTIQKLEKTAELFKERAEMNAKTAKSILNVIDRLKTNIKAAMKLMNTDTVGGGEVRFKLSAVSPRLVIHNESEIPATFLEIVQTTVVNKKALKAELEKGNHVPGAHLEESNALRVYLNKGTV